MFAAEEQHGYSFGPILRAGQLSSLMLLLVLLSSGETNGSERDIQREGEDCKKRFQAAWSAIQEVSPDTDKYPPDSAEYWVEMSFEAYRKFAPLAHGDHADAWLKFFVNQFGKHGGDADLRWLLVAPEYTMPIRGGSGFSADDPRGKIASTISKQIVRRCVADKVFLERYCTAVLWSRRYIRTEGDLETSVHLLSQSVPKSAEADPLYWIWARPFVVALFVTSRQDLLADAVPDKLHSVFPD